MLLVDVRHLYSLSYFKFAFVYRFQPHDQAEQRCFSCTVRANHTDNTVRRQHKVQIVKQQFVSVCLRHVLGFNDFVAQTRTVRNEDFKFFFLLFHILIQEFVVRVKTCLTLCLTGFRSHTHPFQLTLQGLTAFAGCLLLHFHTFGLLFQPGRVVTFPGNAFTTIQFENPSGNMVEEITVVRHCNNCSLILLEMLFQPVDRLCVQVVGRLVKQQNIRLLQQQAAEGDTTTLSSGEICHRLIFGRTAKGVHRTLQFAIQIPCVCRINDILQLSLTGEKSIHLILILIVFRQSEFLVDFFVFRKCVHNGLNAFHYYFFYRFCVVQIGFLRQITHRISRREYNFSLIGFLQTCNNLQQGRFTGAVQTDYTDLSSIEE